MQQMFEIKEEGQDGEKATPVRAAADYFFLKVL